ncbi:hypothetical protein pipiens_014380, partial [Culex pipiens pipiens]
HCSISSLIVFLFGARTRDSLFVFPFLIRGHATKAAVWCCGLAFEVPKGCALRRWTEWPFGGGL